MDWLLSLAGAVTGVGDFRHLNICFNSMNAFYDPVFPVADFFLSDSFTQSGETGWTFTPACG